MTADDLQLLAVPFPESDIEWRVQRAGEKDGRVWAQVVAYITNRAIMDRLDTVCGPTNWKNELHEWQGAAGARCGISIRIDGEWITKYDVSDNTDIEAVKGGVSGAMKRAGVQWGIGRYLYHLEGGWADVREDGMLRGEYKSGNTKRYFRYNPPPLPTWALPVRVDQETGEILAPPEKPNRSVSAPKDDSDKTISPQQYGKLKQEFKANGWKLPTIQAYLSSKGYHRGEDIKRGDFLSTLKDAGDVGVRLQYEGNEEVAA